MRFKWGEGLLSLSVKTSPKVRWELYCVLCLYLLIKSAARCLWGSLDNLFTLATRPAGIITCIDFCKFWDILHIWCIEIVVMY